ncbi:MAG: NUDIX hydrolase [Microgenomates group bacterium]
MNIKKGPWIITDSTTKYENPWISVKEDTVIRPDGEKGIFGFVKMKPGITVLPLDSDENVYLTKEYHYAVERETLEAISGGIDTDETKEEAAKRELHEETGILAGEWIDLGVIDPFTSVVDSPNYLFLARNLEFSQPNLEGTETLKVMKIPLREAIRLVMKSEITHGASVAVILKAKEFLNL